MIRRSPEPIEIVCICFHERSDWLRP